PAGSHHLPRPGWLAWVGTAEGGVVESRTRWIPPRPPQGPTDEETEISERPNAARTRAAPAPAARTRSAGIARRAGAREPGPRPCGRAARGRRRSGTRARR